MECLATLEAHVKKTGEYVGKVEVITGCDCCEDLDEFFNEHSKDIAEYLYNRFTKNVNPDGLIFALRLVELEDEPDEDEADELFNEFVRWFE